MYSVSWLERWLFPFADIGGVAGHNSRYLHFKLSESESVANRSFNRLFDTFPSPVVYFYGTKNQVECYNLNNGALRENPQMHVVQK